MTNKKVLYLSPGCFDKGGISRYNRYQITALREILGAENIRVYALLPPQDGDFEDDFEVSWHAWGISKISKATFTLKVLKTIWLWKPDILWMGHVNLTELAVRFNLFKKTKTILNIYGLEVWSGLRSKVEEGLKRVDQVISDCHFTARYVEAEGLRQAKTTIVIWDCVDLEKFKSLKHKDSDLFYKNYNLPNPMERPWILTLGRLSFTAAHKGYERLIEVFSKLAALNNKAVLIFAGNGDMIDHLKTLAITYKVSDRVYFSGMVHEHDMPKFYSVARVFSLVSDRGIGRGEGIPLTPLEAMACGVPIIVGNQDGSQEAVFQDKNGFCINPFNLEQHQNHLIRLLNDDTLHNAMALQAMAIAKKEFSYTGFKAKHNTFLSDLDD